MTARSPRGSRRARANRVAWALLAVGAVAGLAAAGRDWWRITSDSGHAALDGSTVSGGLATALPAVALVGLVLSWTLRTLGKRVLAVLLAAAGAAMTGLGLAHPRPSDAALLDALRTVSLADRWQAAPTGWVWGYAAAGLAVLAGAVLSWLGARGSRSADRFRRDVAGVQGPVETAGPGDAGGPEEDVDEASLWKALDAGVDPTEQPAGTRFHRSDPARPE